MRIDNHSAELYSIALGIPRWLRHIRTVNSINTLFALLLSAVVIVSRSLAAGLAYLGIFVLGWSVVSGLGAMIAQRRMVLGVISSTIMLILLNMYLAIRFFY